MKVMIMDDGNNINNNEPITSKYFEYKIKIMGTTLDDNNTLDKNADVTLKYLSNFWGLVNLLLINSGKLLDFSWSKECMISKISKTHEVSVIIQWQQYKQLELHFK